MYKLIRINIGRYLELLVWLSALIALAMMNPTLENHFSICIFKLAGISFCPGCGLGHSVAWIFHGDIQRSLQAHPLGIFAAGVLFHRIYILIKTINSKQQKNYHYASR